MEFRIYDQHYGADNVLAELSRLIQSHDPEAKKAGARFYLAMTQMEHDGRSYGRPVPVQLVNGFTFLPPAALRVRPANGHHLYFSFIMRPVAPKGEVRVLLAAADAAPDRVSAGKSADRHNAM